MKIYTLDMVNGYGEEVEVGAIFHSMNEVSQAMRGAKDEAKEAKRNGYVDDDFEIVGFILRSYEEDEETSTLVRADWLKA